MPLPSAGKDLSLQRVESTGLFDLQWDDTGNPTFTDDGSHIVMSLLLEYQGMWWVPDTERRGSLLYTVKEDIASSASRIKAYADEALTYGVETGQLATFNTSVKKLGTGKYTLFVNWEMPSGLTGILPVQIGY